MISEIMKKEYIIPYLDIVSLQNKTTLLVASDDVQGLLDGNTEMNITYGGEGDSSLEVD